MFLADVPAFGVYSGMIFVAVAVILIVCLAALLTALIIQRRRTKKRGKTTEAENVEFVEFDDAEFLSDDDAEEHVGAADDGEKDSE